MMHKSIKSIALLSAAAAGLCACASEEVKKEAVAPATTVAVAAKPAATPAARPTTPVPVRIPADTAASARPAAPLSAVMPAKRSIYYDFDESLIKAEFRPIIEAHAKFMANNRMDRITVEGNCDERGSREYNLALGQRRADSVKTMLKLLGVAENRIETVSFGEEKPVAQGHDEAAWWHNRRSDFVYKVNK